MFHDDNLINEETRPDILLIICDQLRYDCIGSSRARPVRTPGMDSIAGGGVRFTNAFTPQPICCPARQSLLTSRRPERDGFLWNHDIALKTPSMVPGERLWPVRLNEAGYRMAYAGKWHESESHPPTAFGFDTYDGDADYKVFREQAYGPAVYINGIDGEIDPVPTADTHTHWLARQACLRLEKLINTDTRSGNARHDNRIQNTEFVCRNNAGNDDRRQQHRNYSPWFMRVDFTEPHPPYRPAAEFAQMYDPNEIAPWESFSEDFFNKPYIQKQMLHTWGMENYDWSRWAGIVARYYAYVSQLDDAIGCILDTLERSGRRDDTLIILSTDHGDMCGAHRMIDKHNVLYDDIVHVPLLMKWPRVLPRGRAIDAFVHNTLDIGPTLLEASGLPAPEYADGRSLFPLLSGDIPSDWRDCAVSTYNGQQFGLYTQRMVRDNEWKYIWNTADVDELYCLRADPAELVNRIYDPHCNEIIKNMRRKLHDVLINEGDGLLKSHWMRDQLTGVTRKL